MTGADRRPPLVRLFAQWTALLGRHSPPGVRPLLRLETGAGLVRGPRAELVARLLPPLLTVAAPRLFVADGSPAARPGRAPRAAVRPKLRAALSLGGAGLLAELRYFGAAPDDAGLRAAFTPLAPHAHALPVISRPGTRTGEVCLRAVWSEGPRRWPLVQVMAGRREVALPMFSVLRALSRDEVDGAVPDTHSLADCLGEEPVPAAHDRPAVLVLRRRGEPVALRVESLLGHGVERVLPVGPLLLGTPWLLGVVEREAQVPVLVIDPLALPCLERAGAG